VLEALAAGLPVVISPGCNLPEVAEHGAGLVVPPDAEALAAALRDLLSDPARRAAMSVAARQLVETHFTWDTVAVKLEQVYASVGISTN
jgi:poly(glycerol-phosphate) alpha-glucosyltransferase